MIQMTPTVELLCPMLHEFLEANRLELISRCRANGNARLLQSPTATEVEYGVPVLIDQLLEMLRTVQVDQTPLRRALTRYGSNSLRRLIVGQVVRDYHDLAAALIDLALEKNERISVAEFQTLDRCFDSAIAGAIAAAERQ